MKNNFGMYLLFFVGPFICQLAYSQKIPKGLVQISHSYPSYDNARGVTVAGTPKKSKIWFNDSCVIYEFRVEYQTSDQTPEGTVIKQSYPVGAYIFHDLRTMKCQSYYNFKDTAIPRCNFILKPDESIVWNFSQPKNMGASDNLIVPMSDTSVNNILYKRIKLTKKPTLNESLVYYLKSNFPKSIFHLNRALDEKYRLCKVTRWDLINTNTNQVEMISEYEFLSYTLSETEKIIFKQWGENTKNIKLPLLSYEEALKNLSGPLQHENPTIKILPLRDK